MQKKTWIREFTPTPLRLSTRRKHSLFDAFATINSIHVPMKIRREKKTKDFCWRNQDVAIINIL
jgi:hypothetical protein